MRVIPPFILALGFLLPSGEGARAAEPDSPMLRAALTTLTGPAPSVDFNGDGTPDFVRRFDASGRLIHLSLDADLDGRMDRVEEVSGDRLHVSEDRNGDGHHDYWLIRPARPDAPYGRVEQADTDYDGNTDLWAWENLSDDGKRIRRTELTDTDGDGAFDREVETSRPRYMSNQDPEERPWFSGPRGPGGIPGLSGVSGPTSPPGAPSPVLDRSGRPIPVEQILERAVCRAQKSAQSTRTIVDSLERLIDRIGPWQGTPAPGPHVTAPVAERYGVQIGGSCAATPMQMARLLPAVERSVEDSIVCLGRRNPRLMMRFLAFLVRERPEINCVDPGQFRDVRNELIERDPPERPERPRDDEPPEEDPDPNRPPDDHYPTAIHSDGTRFCGLGEVNGRRIWLNTDALTPPPNGCIPLEGVIFHEFLHNLGVGTSGHHTPGDLTDSVYGCELACFGGAGGTMPHRERACKAAR